MGNKTDQLRAMREANATAVEKPRTSRGMPSRLTNKEITEIVEGADSAMQSREQMLAQEEKSVPKRATKKAVPAKKVPSATVRPRKRTGRPLASKAHLTNEARKPWEAKGVSRRTWYRRQAEKRSEA
jgi:hypothetical protein